MHLTLLQKSEIQRRTEVTSNFNDNKIKDKITEMPSQIDE